MDDYGINSADGFKSVWWWCSVAQSCPTLVTPWTVAHKAPLCMGFPRQENWSGLPFPSPGDLPNPGIEPESPTLAGRFFTNRAMREAPTTHP